MHPLEHRRDVLVGRRRERVKDRGRRRRGASEDAIEHERMPVEVQIHRSPNLWMTVTAPH
jgi:hypothetical protein